MVLGVVMIATMLPTMIGLNQATQSTRDQEEDRRANARKTRTHLMATCTLDQGTLEQRKEIHNAHVQVGLDGKLYITKHPSSTMVPFNGGYFTHPEFPPENTAGMVTVSGEETPTLRWVFLDALTHELRWGGRDESAGQICGPYDWTKDELYMTLDGWEGWLAVRLPEDEDQAEGDGEDDEITNGRWRLYFDQNDNGADLPSGAQVLEIRLKRVLSDS
ncbi:hypothetical protein N7495_004475 [Penicillium taxi]|uniref:uncharacterized protein n=1 Tax=Penicillium taxi TaxID=168475 RepID=UPI0025451B14|nr:uncharacterized protein N7495_004475 [Penicillium taxi]KAJ5899731.1 hypothetical protein N7495_004475 [Penicillium taxi]